MRYGVANQSPSNSAPQIAGTHGQRFNFHHGLLYSTDFRQNSPRNCSEYFPVALANQKPVNILHNIADWPGDQFLRVLLD